MNVAVQSASADALDVSRTAGLLDTSEFQLFQMAYRFWYGHDADERLVERYFSAYLFHDDVPFWVRHFIRQVYRCDEPGHHDPSQFSLPPGAPDPQEITRGRWHALWFSCFALLLVLWLAS